MTLQQFRHLIAMAECGSFSKAAAEVFLTQPALSRSIRALEDELGQPLFDRIGRRVELTPFGREALDRARQIVLDAEDLQRRAGAAAGAAVGHLRIGLGSGPAALLMTPLLLAASQAPALRISVSRGSTDLLVQSLRARTLDALVVDARSLRPAPDLRDDFIHEMSGAFLVRRGHPLARRRAPMPFEALAPYPIASTPLSDEVARVLVERYGPQAHPDVCVRLRCDELSSLIEVAEQGDSVLLAVRGAAPRLVELRLSPALDATARFGLVTLARRTEPPGLDLVRALMRERMRSG